MSSARMMMTLGGLAARATPAKSTSKKELRTRDSGADKEKVATTHSRFDRFVSARSPNLACLVLLLAEQIAEELFEAGVLVLGSHGFLHGFTDRFLVQLEDSGAGGFG